MPGTGMKPTVMRMALLLTVSLAAVCLTARADDLVVVRTNYYSVRGETLRELRRSLDLNRPQADFGAHDAQTIWRFECRSESQAQHGEFRLRAFEVKSTITITLPSWTPPPNASPELRNFWLEYFVALRTHEWGHAKIALEVAPAMQARVREVAPRQNREEFIRLVTAQARAVQQEAEHRQKEYDEVTRHGATQGAVWRHGRPVWR